MVVAPFRPEAIMKLQWYGVTANGQVVRNISEEAVMADGAVGELIKFPFPIPMEEATKLILFGVSQARSAMVAVSEPEQPATQPVVSGVDPPKRVRRLTPDDEVSLRNLVLQIRQIGHFDKVMEEDWTKVDPGVIYLWQMYVPNYQLKGWGFTDKQIKAIRAHLRATKMTHDVVQHLIDLARESVEEALSQAS